MGKNIGSRLIDELLAKADGVGRCKHFRETAEVVARVGFRMFLGITAEVVDGADDKRCRIAFKENPLAEFVELPEDDAFRPLVYSAMLCGVVEGALE